MCGPVFYEANDSRLADRALWTTAEWRSEITSGAFVPRAPRLDWMCQSDGSCRNKSIVITYYVVNASIVHWASLTLVMEFLARISPQFSINNSVFFIRIKPGSFSSKLLSHGGTTLKNAFIN